MEVDAKSFASDLLGLLADISEADFVAFDLELSGIPSRLQNKPTHNHDRSSLEARYAEAKAGAERYQILQVGITCARFDYNANSYVLRPYNINISPLLNERLDFERDICFQSGACSFLLEHGFDLAAPFTHGVQYLSREEAQRAKQLAWDRIDKVNPVEDVQLKATDLESLDFVRRVREAVTKWKPKITSCLDITSQTGLNRHSNSATISNFEKRLVHQLIRAEFPDYVSVGRQNCIQIKEFDSFREAEYTRRKKDRVKEQIVRQTGFRWVFEALTQDPNIKTSDILQVLRGSPGVFGDVDDIKRRFDRAIDRLKRKTTVLVGHNMFTDIVYFYHTFVGYLPDTLREFNQVVHELFPRIVDTKYLATYAKGEMQSPSLAEIEKMLKNQALPKIITHEDFSGYDEVEALHEAGYDSLLTARIMLRLAAKLGSERVWQTEAPQKNIQSQSQKNSTSVAEASSTSTWNKVPSTGGSSASKPKNTNTTTKTKERPDQKFQNENIFDTLRDISMDLESENESGGESSPKPGKQANGSAAWENEPFVQDKSNWVPVKQVQRSPMELIPSFESEFWEEFGNKLRLIGTNEAVLRLPDWE